jgi:hypothetical protein
MIHFNYEQWTREHDRQMAQHAHEMALLDAQWQIVAAESVRIAGEVDAAALSVDALWNEAQRLTRAGQ